MSLEVGSKIGAYEITGLLGTGGMGEVYRGRDTRLQREVAIKVLPGEFAHEPERLARFEREAQMLAALNHPHIAATPLTDGDALHFGSIEAVFRTGITERTQTEGDV